MGKSARPVTMPSTRMLAKESISMTDSVAAVVQLLAERGVGFHITHPNPGGSTTVALDKDEIIRYAADPVGFLGQHYDVTRDEYLGWHQAGYNVQCGGTTARGHRCKATAVGLTMIYSPKKWVESQGAYCAVHG